MRSPLAQPLAASRARRFSLWPRRPGAPVARRPPPTRSTAMFARARRGLTLWYMGVLALALLAFGVVLYTGLRQTLLHPIDRRLLVGAHRIGKLWRTQPEGHCPPARLRLNAGTVAWACFTTEGRLITSSDPGPANTGFFDRGLVAGAVRSGPSYESVAAAGETPTMRLLALRIMNRKTHRPLGVVLVGVSIQGELNALGILLRLLLGTGAATVLCAAAGGALLSGRALAPARLAVERQQAFIADASHELRTPLTLLRADAEVLLRSHDSRSPDDTALLEDIVAEATHMGRLATDLLTLARLDAGQLAYEPDLLDLRELATGLARRMAAHAAGSQVTLTVDAPAPVLAIADRGLLEQLLLILLDNAVKYNRPGGSVAVGVAQRGDRSSLTIADTGRGIAAEHLARLGERFYRVDKARSRETGGAGLGLSIAQGLAAIHGGTLALTSVPEQGTVATLTLPAPAAAE